MKTLNLVVLVLLLCLPAAWAQDTRANTPAGPYPALYADQGAGKEDAASALVPDNTPVTGALVGGLGFAPELHSYIMPRARFAETLDSSPYGGSLRPSMGYVSVTSLVGDVEVLHTLGRLGQLFYAGGARYNTDQADVISFHALGFSRTFHRRSWSLTVNDQLGYTPASPFGSQGLEGTGGFFGSFGSVPSVTGVHMPKLNETLVPNQSILTNNGGHLSNTVATQAEYRLSARNSLTTSGSYGLLRSLEQSTNDGNQYNVSAGFERVIMPGHSLGVMYAHSLLTFGDLSRDINSNSVSVMYGRRITGRISVSGGAGAQFFTVSQGSTSISDVNWSARSALAWKLGVQTVSLRYLRAITGGSGVLPGANTDSVELAVNRPVTQRWEGGVHLGYARNRSLDDFRRYETEFAGVTVSRRVTRYVGVFFNYNLEHQKLNHACTGPNCGVALLQHVFGFGVSWNYRPIGIL